VSVADYQLTVRAAEDLREIGRYIASENLRAATKLVDTLEKHFMLLAENQNFGRARPDIAPDLRYSPVKNYLVFYRPIPGGVEIVRVVHSRRNITQALFEE
jgi:toxin ParE1/3/4